MGKIKKLASQLPLLVVWALLSVILWGWIFTLVTSPSAQNKLTIAVDGTVRDSTAWAVEMEKIGAEQISRCMVYPFSYALMSTQTLENADLLIISEEDLPEKLDWLACIPEAFLSEDVTFFESEGIKYGILIENAARSALEKQVLLDEAQSYYLCFGKQSVHNEEIPGAVDNVVSIYAKWILSGMEEEFQ